MRVRIPIFGSDAARRAAPRSPAWGSMIRRTTRSQSPPFAGRSISEKIFSTHPTAPRRTLTMAPTSSGQDLLISIGRPQRHCRASQVGRFRISCPGEALSPARSWSIATDAACAVRLDRGSQQDSAGFEPSVPLRLAHSGHIRRRVMGFAAGADGWPASSSRSRAGERHRMRGSREILPRRRVSGRGEGWPR
jgi:hypothetical protein